MSRFDDPDDLDRPPEDLTPWLAAGFRRVDALAWRRWNFTLEDARRWQRAGVRVALAAAQWQAAAVSPATVGSWLAEKITASEAIRWHEFGFDLDQAREHRKHGRGPDQAFGQHQVTRSVSAFQGGAIAATGPVSAQASAFRAFMRSGAAPNVLAGYMQAHWTDEDAVAWAKQGIQAWDARTWRMIGLTPAEAAELQNADVRPERVIEEWWRAGIPFEEVADWLGAGLTASEAVEQRAAGVTQEQAAALRALRRGGGTP